jgi:hypothetical protein
MDLKCQPNVPAYKHAKLDHGKGQKSIHLINLFFGRHDDLIQCSIHHVDLADKPHYEAVSYTWADETGDSTPSSTIHYPQTTLRVTKNSEQALRRIRHVNKNRWIWLDSVSIDQADVGERNHQVAMMQDIYTKASRVLIYAGESAKRSNRLLLYLRDPTNLFPGDKLDNILPSLHHARRALWALLKRRWF